MNSLRPTSGWPWRRTTEGFGGCPWCSQSPGGPAVCKDMGCPSPRGGCCDSDGLRVPAGWLGSRSAPGFREWVLSAPSHCPFLREAYAALWRLLGWGSRNSCKAHLEPRILSCLEPWLAGTAFSLREPIFLPTSAGKAPERCESGDPSPT